MMMVLLALLAVFGFTIVRRLERLFLIARCVSMTTLPTTFIWGRGRGFKIMALFALDGE